jgi:rfaE bifunctional protein nucleotidyltransferase chain/domain
MHPHPSLCRKILALPDLLARLELLREPGAERPRVVFTNGCFDLLHPGHVDLLARAREMGDLLVLGLNSDASVLGLKGPSRPVTPWQDRALVLAGLSCVDFVVGFDDPTPLALIEAVLPDVLVKGGDWAVEAIVGREVVEAAGGSVVSLALLPGYSTTGVIARIKAS